MASFAPIKASGWKVESAIFGPPVQSNCRLRSGTLVSGPLVSSCNPIRSIHYHCPKEGHNDIFGLHGTAHLQLYFRVSPRRSKSPEEIESFTRNLSDGFHTGEDKADNGSYKSGYIRRLILCNLAENRDPTFEEINEILAAACKDPYWRPQMCYVSTKGYTTKLDYLRIVEGFDSNGFNTSTIETRLGQDMGGNSPGGLRIQTVMVIGKSTTEKFQQAVKKLTTKIPHTVDTGPNVARLQTKTSEQAGNYWNRDYSLPPGQWELKSPVSLKRKRDD